MTGGAGGSGPSHPRVICLGETMLMFAPPRHELIEYSIDFKAYHGGSESNVAIGLERLGIHAGWVSKLPHNALGRKVVNELRAFGVDTSSVVWTEEGRVGLFFFEWAAPPRPLMTIYDRRHTAVSTLVADDLDWDYIAGAEWLHMTGITPCLSDTCRLSVPEIAKRARAAGVKVSFDVNYRSLLTTRDEACRRYTAILPYVNLLIATEEDAQMFLDEPMDREKTVRTLFSENDFDAVVMTLGEEGSIAYDGTSVYTASGYEVETVNRLGAGDAFVAGLLYGYLHQGLGQGLNYGMAMAALKMTIPQNIPLVNKEDVERLLAGRHIDVVR
ncbi:MAG: sugar kinase [Chloroflexota bacterium]|nr:sugar kinase [Chloroflexota bacterium]